MDISWQIVLLHRSSGRLLAFDQKDSQGLQVAPVGIRREAWIHLKLAFRLFWGVWTGKATKPQ